MSQRDIYVLCLCIVVLVLFVALFSYLVASLVTTKLKIIKAGLDDQRIITEYQQNKKKNPHTEGLYKVLSVIMACIFCALFALTLPFVINYNKRQLRCDFLCRQAPKIL